MALPTLGDLVGFVAPSGSPTPTLPTQSQPSSSPTGPPNQTISDWILNAVQIGAQAFFGTAQANQQQQLAQQQAAAAQQRAQQLQNTLIGVGAAALLIIGLLVIFGGKSGGPSLGSFVAGSKSLQLKR